MKKTLLFLLISVVFFSVNAKKTETRISLSRNSPMDEFSQLPDSVIMYDSEGNKSSKTYYSKTTDGAGIIEEEFCWDNIINDWRYQTRSIRRFDVFGNESYHEDFYWDETKWVGVNKYVQVFNEQGIKLLHEHYFWNVEMNDWQGASRYIVESDSESRITLQENYQWDYSENKWIGTHKYKNTFDSYGNLNSSVYFMWDIEKNDWEITYKTNEEYLPESDILLSRETYQLNHDTGILYLSNKDESTIGENGKPMEILSYSLDMLSNEMTISNKESCFYDGKDRLIRREHYSYYMQEWIPIYKIEYVFDDDDRLIELISFNSVNMDWKFLNRQVYSYYNNNGNEIEEVVVYSWSNSSNQWIHSYRSLSGKDSFGNSTLTERYKWNTSLKRWDGESYYLTEYNEANRQTLVLYQAWDNSLGTWIGNTKHIYSFRNDTILQVIENYSWDKMKNKWIGSNKTEYDYNDSGKINRNVFSSWDSLMDNWVYSIKHETYYNEDNKAVFITSSTWNRSALIWQMNHKEEYLYDDLKRIKRNDVYYYDESDFVLQYYRIYYYSNFAISENNLLFDAKGGDLSVDITTDTQWTIVNAPEWLSITPMSGSGNTTLTFSTEANVSTEELSAVVEIKLASITLPETIKVNVLQKAPSVVELPKPNPVPVTHIVTVLPSAGVMTNPSPGEYEIRENRSFHVEIVVNKYFDTSEIALRVNNELIPLSTQDAYSEKFSYTIPSVTSDMVVEVIGVKLFPMVGNITPENNIKVYTSGNNLFIDTPDQTDLMIHTIKGQTVLHKRITAGISSYFLSAGVYIVAAGKKVTKVIIK